MSDLKSDSLYFLFILYKYEPINKLPSFLFEYDIVTE